MDVGGSQDSRITMPVSVSYSAIQETSKPKIAAETGEGVSGNGGGSSRTLPVEPRVRYRECRKNFAASRGGYAVDGCGEFIPSGEEHTGDAYKCAACQCHRNFHRKEVEGEPGFSATAVHSRTWPHSAGKLEVPDVGNSDYGRDMQGRRQTDPPASKDVGK